MKKNTKKISVILLLVVVALGSYFVSSTYAKYTSDIEGSDTASVAKWAWEISGVDITSAASLTNGYSFDLFDTIKDSNLSSNETDVTSGYIAPGTGGSFEISIKNKSEVNATYEISFVETNANNIPIEYSTDGSTWVSPITDVAATAINIGQTKQLTVYWRWAFTGSASTNYTSTQTDTTDTALGFAANTTRPSVKVDATVTVTQVD